MEDNSKEINDIVSRTANLIGCGKKFGGWTDNSTNEAFLKIPAKANTKPKKKGSMVGRIIKGMLSAGKPTKKGDELVKIGPDSSRPENERQYTKTTKVESVVHENVSNLSHNAKGLLSAAINATNRGDGPDADHGNVHFFEKPAHDVAMKFLATKEIHPDHEGSHEELKKYFPVEEAVLGGVIGSMIGRGVAGMMNHPSGTVRAVVRGAGDQVGYWVGDKVSGNRQKKKQAQQQAQQQ